jgi:glycosyltransferase involved in cell wall biosynthesis
VHSLRQRRRAVAGGFPDVRPRDGKIDVGTELRVRILHIISGLGQGGAEAALVRLLAASEGSDRHVVISLSDLAHNEDPLIALGVPVLRIDLRSRGGRMAKLVRIMIEIQRCNPDVVQLWMYHANVIGGILATMAGVRRIVWGIHHSAFEEGGVKDRTRLFVRTGAVLSHFASDAIISCSAAGAAIHARAGYSSRAMHVVPNGYDFGRFRPDPVARAHTRAGLGLAENAVVVGMVARWDPVKDHRNFIAAAEIVLRKRPGTRFVLCGQGISAENPSLKALLQPAEIAGAFSLIDGTRTVERIFSALDVNVLASRSEAFPNVLVEALACGVPCVATEVGDARTIVGPSGCVVPPRNAVALADAMMSLVEMPEAARREMGDTGRLRVCAQYSIGAMYKSYRAVWGCNKITACEIQ